MNNSNKLTQDPIRHIVLLMMENHSFDQMLGCMQEIYPDLDGVDPNSPRYNLDNNGNKIFQRPTTETQITLDPNHDCENVMTHLADNNSGFVKDFITTYPKCTLQQREYIMGYYPLDFLPALHTLAKDFTVCDHWFASVPGPTWPNRFFVLSGTASGRVRMPEGIRHPDISNTLFDQNQKTIFDCLTEAGKTWQIYYYDFPLSLIFTRQRTPEKLSHYQKIEKFFHSARGPESSFPEFTFIEPKYLDIDQNDDHPPHNVMKAEKLIADVYNAIRSNPALWESTLLVVVYDEHGGFYDHVPPPPAVPPDAHAEEYKFDRLGVRVPAILISPWVNRGVEKTVFDHTSLLNYLVNKWQLSSLGERVANANTLAGAFHFDRPSRTDTSPFIRVSNTVLISKDIELEKWDSSVHHKAIHKFADFLAETLKANAEIEDWSKRLSWARLKAKIGALFIKIGKWFQGDLEHRRSKRIARTCAIADQVISVK